MTVNLHKINVKQVPMLHMRVLMYLNLFFVSLFSGFAYAATVTLMDASGKPRVISQGFGLEAFQVAYDLLNQRVLLSITQEETTDRLSQKIIISQTAYEQMSLQLHSWVSLPQSQFSPLPVGLLTGNAFFVDPTLPEKLNKFYFTDSKRKNPILYTNAICECITVIGHNPVTQSGFIAHLTFWFEGNLEETLKTALDRLQQGVDGKAEVHLITRQVSNFGVKVLDIVQALGFKPQVSSTLGMFQMSHVDPETKLQTIHQVVGPRVINFDHYISKFVQSLGRTIYYDSRDGRVYEE